MYLDGFLNQRLLNPFNILTASGYLFHSFGGPEEVAGGGPGGGDGLADLAELRHETIPGFGLDIQSAQRDAIGTRHADGRRAADFQFLDGGGDIPVASEFQIDLSLGQARLVEQSEPVTQPFYGSVVDID